MEFLEELEIESLVGRKIISAKINEDKDYVLLETDTKNFHLSWVGDCCAHCYLEHVSGVEELVGGTILSIEHMEWKDVSRNEEDFEVLESMGTKIKTDKGYVTMESRVQHNGYYGGEIAISDVCALDTYGSRRFEEKEYPEMKPLEDF